MIDCTDEEGGGGATDPASSCFPALRLSWVRSSGPQTLLKRVRFVANLPCPDFPPSSAHSTLLSLHCTAVLRHDSTGQEMLMNLILRNYLHYNLYDQASAVLLNESLGGPVFNVLWNFALFGGFKRIEFGM